MDLQKNTRNLNKLPLSLSSNLKSSRSMVNQVRSCSFVLGDTGSSFAGISTYQGKYIDISIFVTLANSPLAYIYIYIYIYMYIYLTRLSGFFYEAYGTIITKWIRAYIAKE